MRTIFRRRYAFLRYLMCLEWFVIKFSLYRVIRRFRDSPRSMIMHYYLAVLSVTMRQENNVFI